MNPRVAIIGLAGILPQARNLKSYWQNIVDCTDCITDVPPSRWNIDEYYDPDPSVPDKTYCKRGGFIPDIDFNPLEFGLPPNILEVTDVSQLLSLVVAKQAMEDAGYGKASEAIRQRTGVVLGVGGGQKLMSPLNNRLQYPVWEKVLKSSGLAEEDIQSIIEKLKLAYIKWEENSFPGMLGNVIAGRIANRLDLGGMNCVVDAACASSLSAIRVALSELTEYRSDMMITGGVDTDNSIFMYMSFSKTPAFSKQQKISPFDVDSDGMLIGEGIGMMVLKRLEDAQRDGDRIYAVITGMGTSSDGKYKSIYAPRESGQAVALHRAYADAGFSPGSVGLVEAHGTGTMAGDPTEFAALNQVFSQSNSRKQYIALGSVKSQIGHTKSAAGAASLIKAALALHHKILPPTININKPNPKLQIEDSPFYLNTETRPWLSPEKDVKRRAGVSSFGFGGTNYHLVLEEYEDEHHQAYRLHTVPSPILLASATREELLSRCLTVQSQLQSDAKQQHYIELINSCQALQIPLTAARVGFVAASLAETLELLQITIETLKNQAQAESWEHPQGIYYRKTGIDSNGRVVALFSGQGSQYLEMGKELAINFPQMRQAYAQMDSLLLADQLLPISSRVFPAPVFDKAQKDTQVAALQNTENAQPAIGAFSVGLYKIFQQAGFKADFAAGHSFGELTALWCAEVLCDEDYFALVKARGQAMASSRNGNVDTGAMLAVIGNISKLQALIADFPQITIANWNSHNQVVLAGNKSEITKIQQILDKNGYAVVLLPVSAAFHTPLVDYAHKPFAQAIRTIRFSRPKIPVFCNITGDVYPQDPEKIRHTLTDHILNPVLFKQEIENIYASGGYVFVEFGPKNTLTNLVKNILGDQPHLAIALNPQKRQGSKQSPIPNSDRLLRESVVQLRVAGLALGNIDPYQLQQPAPITQRKNGLTISLNGNNYVSENTKAAFAKALENQHPITSVETSTQQPIGNSQSLNEKQANTGITANSQVIPATQPAVSIPSPAFTTPENLPMSQSPLNNQPGLDKFEQMMMLFYEHQAEVLRVHEQYLKSQAESSQTLLQLMQSQYLPLNGNDSSISSVVNVGLASKKQLATLPSNGFSKHQETTDNGNTHNNTNQLQTNGTVVTQNIPLASPLPQIITVANSESVNDPEPLDNASQPSDADPTLENQVISLSQREQPPEPETSVLPPAELAALTTSLLQVVSNKTGYPTEILQVEMDMEADLGIDSIKRVEILGAMQELFPDLPPVNPEDLAELRTLGEIVTYLGQSSAMAEKKTSFDHSREKLPDNIQRGVAKLKSLTPPDKLDCTWIADHVCLLTDDGSPMTIKLAQLLTEQGWKVVVLSFPESLIAKQLLLPKGINRLVLADMSETHLQQQLIAIANNYGAISAFIHLSPLTTTTSTAKSILKQVFFMAKYLHKPLNVAAQKGRGWFVTVSRLDGQLGVGGKTDFSPIHGGLFGLTKTLNLEWGKVYCRAIDISPSLEVETAVQSIIAELYDPNILITEVGYSCHGRVTLVGEDEPILNQQNSSNSKITQDSVLLVSGGGRGITAQCVIKLAEYYQCKFILLGRSAINDEPEWSKNCSHELELKTQAFVALNSPGNKPKPTEINKLVKDILATREIKSTLQAIRQLGGQAEYLSCDITDSINLPKQLSSIVNKLGEITGIIHGAGVLADKLIENKTEQDFERVYSTKIEGLEALINSVDINQIQQLILFSSAAGFYGNIGQSDYAIANEILNKFAHQFKHQYPNCQVIAFNWGPWESGMVTPELKQVFAQRGVEVIPVDVGTQVFVNQLSTGHPDTVQVLVGNALVNPSLPLASELKTYRIRRRLTLEANNFLQDHVIRNYAVLPTTFASLWLANTAEQLYPGYRFFSCENYQLLKGIVFDESLADEYILDIKETTKVAEQEINLSATIWSQTKTGITRYHYKGDLNLLKQIPTTPIYEEFDKQQDDQVINLCPYQDGTLFHGDSFQGVKKVLNISEQKITLKCMFTQVESSYYGQFPPQAFNALALDSALQCMLIWVRYFYQSASLPSCYEKGELFQQIPLGQVFYVSMEIKQNTRTKLISNVTLHDEEGNVYIKIVGAEVTISQQLNNLFAPAKDSQYQKVISFWRNFLGNKHPVGETIYQALYKRFVGEIFLEDSEEFHSLNQQPRLYFANHQTVIESSLFAFTISALSNSIIKILAKTEHQTSWVSELFNQIYSYPKLTTPELSFYFNRTNQASMFTLLTSIKKAIIQEKNSLLVHIEGTRSLSCRQPVTNLSAVFIDLALELNLPIIPVKFVGGLPIKPLETRIDFPYRYTSQNYYLGKAIYPENLKNLGNLERKNLILQRLNQLGTEPEKSFPNQPDVNFEKEVNLWMQKTGITEIYAVLYKLLEEVYNPSNEVQALVKGICQGKLEVDDTPEGYWLGEFGKWLSQNENLAISQIYQDTLNISRK